MRNKERIKLFILEGIMPKMNGKEAFKAIKSIDPDAKYISMSGNAGDISATLIFFDPDYELPPPL
jgi:DNA-binding NtrC family response regulator